jgi:hypothetical protein
MWLTIQSQTGSGYHVNVHVLQLQSAVAGDTGNPLADDR